MITDAPAILVITTRVDIASDYVMASLAKLGASFYRINTEDFPLLADSTIRIDRREDRPSWSWRSATDRQVSLDSIKCVWYRRHRLPAMPEEVLDAHAEYCLREADWYLKGALYSTDIASENVEWMSHPANIQMAESKIQQLATAQSLGFDVPDTIITNDTDVVRAFLTKSMET